MTLTLRAYAKINLYLDILEKRDDGYHDLVTVMQSVSLHDTVTLSRRQDDEIRLLESNVSSIPAEKNLVVRAARAYFAASGDPFGVDISLQKTIPMAAGVGGGSADAAAVLRGLNQLDHNRFKNADLAKIGAELGADIPFCIYGGTALCRGIGEVILPAQNNLDGAVVLAIAGESVSTPDAFGAWDRQMAASKKTENAPDGLLGALQVGDLAGVSACLYNAFEAVIEPIRPAVSALKKMMLNAGATAACMSGSGPSVFGLFADDNAAAQAAAALQANGIAAYPCHFIL